MERQYIFTAMYRTIPMLTALWNSAKGMPASIPNQFLSTIAHARHCHATAIHHPSTCSSRSSHRPLRWKLPTMHAFSRVRWRSKPVVHPLHWLRTELLGRKLVSSLERLVDETQVGGLRCDARRHLGSLSRPETRLTRVLLGAARASCNGRATREARHFGRFVTQFSHHNRSLQSARQARPKWRHQTVLCRLVRNHRHLQWERCSSTHFRSPFRIPVSTAASVRALEVDSLL